MAKNIFSINTPIQSSLVNANFTELYDDMDSRNTAWTAFTPSYNAITVGSGTNQGYYKQIGKVVFVRVYWTYGAGAAVGASPTLNLPVNISANYSSVGNPLIGHINFLDATTANYLGTFYRNSASTASLVATTATASYVQDSSVQSNVPFVWTTNDSFNGYLIYEAV